MALNPSRFPSLLESIGDYRIQTERLRGRLDELAADRRLAEERREAEERLRVEERRQAEIHLRSLQESRAREAETRARLAAVEERLRETQERLRETEERLSAVTAARYRAESDLASVLGSRSWRLTSPLRRIVGLFRRN